MKYIKNCLFIILAVIISFSLAACGGSSNSDTYTITFDYNYDGSPEAFTQTVEKNSAVEEPGDPEREHYAFTGWYTDSSCTTSVDFEYAVTADCTYYAGWRLSEVKVTFDYNSDELENVVSYISVGDTIGEPSVPTLSGYIFSGWYLSLSDSETFDFTTAISADTTLIAKWEEKDENTDYCTVTYMWNYDGAPDNGIYSQIEVVKNSKISSLTPQRDGYYLDSGNWYTDSGCTTKFSFTKTRITEDTVLYARWYTSYTFEAEYTYLDDKAGAGYSGAAGGVKMIVKDTYDAEASNGYFVSYLFANGAYLQFDIECEEEVEDAVLELRLSTEIVDITFTSEEYLVEVNGENLTYDDISIAITVEGANTGYSDSKKQPFANFYITGSLHLQKGTNTIRLITNNNRQMGTSGTMYATAPTVDCIYIHTDTVLSWEPYTDNISRAG